MLVYRYLWCRIVIRAFCQPTKQAQILPHVSDWLGISHRSFLGHVHIDTSMSTSSDFGLRVNALQIKQQYFTASFIQALMLM